MMPDFLDKIIKHKREMIKAKRELYANMKSQMSNVTHTRYRLFHRMISAPDKINLIAEIKKASPSQGVIREEFDLMGERYSDEIVGKTYSCTDSR